MITTLKVLVWYGLFAGTFWVAGGGYTSWWLPVVFAASFPVIPFSHLEILLEYVSRRRYLARRWKSSERKLSNR